MDIRLSTIFSVISLGFLFTHVCPVQGQWGLNFGWFWGDLKLPNAKTGIRTTENNKDSGIPKGREKVVLHSGWLFRKQQITPETSSSEEEESDSEEKFMELKRRIAKIKQKSRRRTRWRKPKMSSRRAKKLRHRLRNIYKSRLNKLRRKMKQNGDQTIKSNKSRDKSKQNKGSGRENGIRSINGHLSTKKKDAKLPIQRGSTFGRGSNPETEFEFDGEPVNRSGGRNVGDTTDRPENTTFAEQSDIDGTNQQDRTPFGSYRPWDQTGRRMNIYGKGYSRNKTTNKFSHLRSSPQNSSKSGPQNVASSTKPRGGNSGNNKREKMDGSQKLSRWSNNLAHSDIIKAKYDRNRHKNMREKELTNKAFISDSRARGRVNIADREIVEAKSDPKKYFSTSQRQIIKSNIAEKNSPHGRKITDQLNRKNEIRMRNYQENHSTVGQRQTYKSNTIDKTTPNGKPVNDPFTKTSKSGVRNHFKKHSSISQQPFPKSNVVGANVQNTRQTNKPLSGKNKTGVRNNLGSRRNFWGNYGIQNQSKSLGPKLQSSLVKGEFGKERTSPSDLRKQGTREWGNINRSGRERTEIDNKRGMGSGITDKTSGSGKVFTFDVVNKIQSTSTVNKMTRGNKSSSNPQTLRDKKQTSRGLGSQDNRGTRTNNLFSQNTDRPRFSGPTKFQPRSNTSSPKELSPAQVDRINKMFIGKTYRKGKGLVGMNQAKNSELEPGKHKKDSILQVNGNISNASIIKPNSSIRPKIPIDMHFGNKGNIEYKKNTNQIQKKAFSSRYAKTNDAGNIGEIPRKPLIKSTKVSNGIQTIGTSGVTNSSKLHNIKSMTKDSDSQYFKTGPDSNNVKTGMSNRVMQLLPESVTRKSNGKLISTVSKHKGKGIDKNKSISRKVHNSTSVNNGHFSGSVALNKSSEVLGGGKASMTPREKKKNTHMISEGFPQNEGSLGIKVTDTAIENNGIVNPKRITAPPAVNITSEIELTVDLPSKIKVTKGLSQTEPVNSHQRIDSKTFTDEKIEIANDTQVNDTKKNFTLKRIYEKKDVFSFNSPLKKNNVSFKMSTIDKTATKVWGTRIKEKKYLKLPVFVHPETGKQAKNKKLFSEISGAQEKSSSTNDLLRKSQKTISKKDLSVKESDNVTKPDNTTRLVKEKSKSASTLRPLLKEMFIQNNEIRVTTKKMAAKTRSDPKATSSDKRSQTTNGTSKSKTPTVKLSDAKPNAKAFDFNGNNKRQPVKNSKTGRKTFSKGFTNSEPGRKQSSLDTKSPQMKTNFKSGSEGSKVQTKNVRIGGNGNRKHFNPGVNKSETDIKQVKVKVGSGRNIIAEKKQENLKGSSTNQRNASKDGGRRLGQANRGKQDGNFKAGNAKNQGNINRKNLGKGYGLPKPQGHRLNKVPAGKKITNAFVGRNNLMQSNADLESETEGENGGTGQNRGMVTDISLTRQGTRQTHDVTNEPAMDVEQNETEYESEDYVNNLYNYASEEIQYPGYETEMSRYSGSGNNVFSGSWMNEVREEAAETAREMEGNWKDLNVTVVGGKRSSCPAYKMRYLDNAVVIDTVANKCRIIITWNKRQMREKVKERVWWGYSVYYKARTVYAPVVTYVDLR